MNGEPQFAAEFALSITDALRTQLLERLDELTPVALTSENLAKVAQKGGIYELFLDNDLVYVGKSAKKLNSRLNRHRTKLAGRLGNLLQHVKFRCLYVSEDLDALAPEKMLITELGTIWNNNGFGNNDPGRNRDRSLVSSAHFDSHYPINLDLEQEINLIGDDDILLSDLFKVVKQSLPFNFRYSDSAQSDLGPIVVPVSVLPKQPVAIRDWLQVAADYLPANWELIALPGYVIAYPNIDPTKHESRVGHWELLDGKRAFRQHAPKWSTTAVDQSEA